MLWWQGVMDVLNQFEGGVKLGNAEPPLEQLSVGGCIGLKKGTHTDPTTGALHHDIDPALEKRMRAFYEPFNQKLYRFLGRPLGW